MHSIYCIGISLIRRDALILIQYWAHILIKMLQKTTIFCIFSVYWNTGNTTKCLKTGQIQRLTTINLHPREVPVVQVENCASAHAENRSLCQIFTVKVVIIIHFIIYIFFYLYFYFFTFQLLFIFVWSFFVKVMLSLNHTSHCTLQQ